MIPVGGGILQDDGTSDGFLTYEFVEDEIILLPIDGIALFSEDQENLTISIEKPREKCLYVFDRAIMPLKDTIILGRITIQAEAYSVNDLDRVEFFIDGKLKCTDDESPYQWHWDERIFGIHEIKAVVYDKNGNEAEDEINVAICNIE